MKTFLLQFFTWWNGQTLGTRLWTWRAGIFVGEDHFGNRYYRQANDQRRWVVYNGEAEASRIPPGWYGWMQRRTDTPPSELAYAAHPWEKPHKPNMTGTPAAYRPRGSVLGQEKRPDVTGDYEPWTP